MVISLESVDRTSGTSTAVVTALNDGTAITYTKLLNFDGYINVHLSTGDGLSTIVAQGDVGRNG